LRAEDVVCLIDIDRKCYKMTESFKPTNVGFFTETLTKAGSEIGTKK